MLLCIRPGITTGYFTTNNPTMYVFFISNLYRNCLESVSDKQYIYICLLYIKFIYIYEL